MPGHRELGPRAHRDEQRVVGVADDLAHRALERAAGPGATSASRALRPAAGHVGAAGVGRDREAGRHRQRQHRRHLGQVGALAAEEVLQVHRRLAMRRGRSRRRNGMGFSWLSQSRPAHLLRGRFNIQGPPRDPLRRASLCARQRAVAPHCAVGRSDRRAVRCLRMAQPAIEATRPHKVFGKGNVRALDGLSFETARPAPSSGVLGPNGAGKTTAVRILVHGARPRQRAARRSSGSTSCKDAATVRRIIGLAGQYATVDENLTGRENLLMVGRLSHLSKRHAARAGGRAARAVRAGRRGHPLAQDLLGRHAAPPRPGGGAGGPAAGPLLRRADDRPRPPEPPGHVGWTIEDLVARGHHDPAHDPVPRGGRPPGRPASSWSTTAGSSPRAPRTSLKAGLGDDGHRGRAPARTGPGAARAAGLLAACPSSRALVVDGSVGRAHRRSTAPKAASEALRTLDAARHRGGSAWCCASPASTTSSCGSRGTGPRTEAKPRARRSTNGPPASRPWPATSDR